MPNRKHLYYVGDDVTFRGAFEIDGVAQTPDSGSGTAKIMKRDTGTAIVDTTATISGTQIQYKYTPLVVGRFAIFLGASFDKRSGSPRDNMGNVMTRAPECFYKGSHPERTSDVWSFGSLLTRMLTGKYLLEDEVGKSGDVGEFYRSMDADYVEKVISEQLERSNIHEDVKGFIQKCARVDPSNRYANAMEMERHLKNAVKNAYEGEEDHRITFYRDFELN